MAAIAGAAPGLAAACLADLPMCAAGAFIAGAGAYMASHAGKNAKTQNADKLDSQSTSKGPQDHCNDKYNAVYSNLSRMDSALKAGDGKGALGALNDARQSGSQYLKDCQKDDAHYDKRSEHIVNDLTFESLVHTPQF